MEVRRTPLTDAVAMVVRSEITHAASALAILKTAEWVRANGSSHATPRPHS
jgi:hypothetical protein